MASVRNLALTMMAPRRPRWARQILHPTRLGSYVSDRRFLTELDIVLMVPGACLEAFSTLQTIATARIGEPDPDPIFSGKAMKKKKSGSWSRLHRFSMIKT